MANVLGDALPAPPTDGITQLKFSQFTNTLLASSWDKTIRLYDGERRIPLATYPQNAPVLDISFPDDSTVFAGALDGTVSRLQLPSGHRTVLGLHDAPVRCVAYLPDRGLVVSGSWDQTLKLWDPRAPNPLIKTIGPLPGKVYTMSCSQNKLVVGTSRRFVLIYDTRKLEYGAAEQQRESSLKYQTRCIATYPDGRGYALGSVEGRVAMELFDLSPEVQAGKYAFKCHRRVEENKGEVVYPVHCIAYNSVFGTFGTGGGDGVINIWDGDNKKRLFQVSRYPTSVSAMSFSRDSRFLAVASSYAYEKGDIAHEPDQIYIRPVDASEVRPKAKQAPKPAV
mmetsp:Transcript_5419/g.14633  ORF Transcript_5419/g.14633 Transcript_5419/m.14633 type:complete len:338 (+) Transcript_5419:171-1184(+)|eukprot:CAMPEP_0202353482 /NCGR_PEP_ID=MMETSP1126-20121109/9222_1 /ASSEMBLY_ACC=CAM_ASM_000457 /TAXON_ID=3047 /ORGANISM="Dunaliella tertiolecta, Strain CCMP1320" /LENGTH=337 /DNA_ID=CAMNT_0048945833 /DNA_START=122 /DNA_END=1135 /DNA_ORIENTATION=+